MAECGAQNIYLLQNPASPPPPIPNFLNAYVI